MELGGRRDERQSIDSRIVRNQSDGRLSEASWDTSLVTRCIAVGTLVRCRAAAGTISPFRRSPPFTTTDIFGPRMFTCVAERMRKVADETVRRRRIRLRRTGQDQPTRLAFLRRSGTISTGGRKAAESRSNQDLARRTPFVSPTPGLTDGASFAERRVFGRQLSGFVGGRRTCLPPWQASRR